MNYDVTDNDSTGVTTVTVNDRENSLTVTPKRCKNPLCTRFASLGSDYCKKHGPTETDLFGGYDGDSLGLFENDSDPSLRDLQRQLDRIEGKMDAILAALSDD